MLLATRLEEPDRLAPGCVVDAFLAAAEAGLFGRTAVSNRSHRIAVLRGDGVMADLFEATFSRVPPRAFAVLASMAKASVPGLAGLEIQEQHRDERTLLVRRFEQDSEATLLDVEWAIAFAASESSCLVVRFRESPSAEIAARTAHLLRVWSDVVNLGAYAPPDNASPRAALKFVGPGEPQEIVADFAALACAYDAFEALFEGLDTIHEEHAIERVAIPYRLGETSQPDCVAPRAASRLAQLDSRGADAHG